MTQTPSRDGAARDAEPTVAVQAMLEIERSMIDATHEMTVLTAQLGAKCDMVTRQEIINRLDELTATVSAYLEQIRYLRDRCGDQTFF
jgi:hypothetical protein